MKNKTVISQYMEMMISEQSVDKLNAIMDKYSNTQDPNLNLNQSHLSISPTSSVEINERKV